MSLAAIVLAQVVGLHAPGADQAQVAAAVDGCAQALGAERCIAGDAGDRTEWQATITWADGTQRFARVHLERRSAAMPESVTRDVEFAPGDPIEQRYRAVGLIIAAYVIASGRTRAPEVEEVSEPEPEAPPPRTPPPAKEEASSGWGVDGLGIVGGGFEEGPLRLGAGLKPWWHPASLPFLALAQVRWGRSGGRLATDWLGSSVGLGLRFSPARLALALELRAEVVGEWMLIRAEEPGRREQASSWRYGGRGGADLIVPLAESWALVAGGDVTVLRPSVVVDVAGEPAGRESGLSLQGLFGLRFRQE